MNATMKELGLDKLSEGERTALAHELLESVEAKPEGGNYLTDAKRAELDRRIAEADADPDGGIPWEQVYEEMKARIAKVRK